MFKCYKNTQFKYLLAGLFLNIKIQYENQKSDSPRNIAA